MAFVLVVFFAALLVALVVWFITSPAARTPLPTPPAKPDPYRSSTPPTETAKPADDEPQTVPLPVVIVDWSRPARKDHKFSVTCPACATVWLWDTSAAPELCSCTECDVPHFHVDCDSGGDLKGCGLDWIMRSALSKPPIITPPPAITDTTKESS